MWSPRRSHSRKLPQSSRIVDIASFVILRIEPAVRAVIRVHIFPSHLAFAKI